ERQQRPDHSQREVDRNPRAEPSCVRVQVSDLRQRRAHPARRVRRESRNAGHHAADHNGEDRQKPFSDHQPPLESLTRRTPVLRPKPAWTIAAAFTKPSTPTTTVATRLDTLATVAAGPEQASKGRNGEGNPASTKNAGMVNAGPA